MTYSAPTISEAGSVRELTLGQGWQGDADQFVIAGHVLFTYGQS